MKTKLILFLLSAVAASGQSLTSLYDIRTVNGTSNGVAVSVSGVRVPSAVYYIQTGGITNAPYNITNVVNGVTNVVNGATNSVRIPIAVSLDGTNWVTLTNLYPLNTNATIHAVELGSVAIPVYLRPQVVTTNPITVGVFKQ